MKVVGALVLTAVLIAAIVFLGPWLVLMGWNAARELWPELPVATYWQSFWITAGITTLFGRANFSKLKKDED